ncbi:hypothetical protein OG933_20695 [Streptomyces sp. NBC_00016]|uniref:wHTH domain-containing protein n=1 Tax=Streptomyces sp. NBC_00016 TaxID=2975622 RepID=UPI0032468397
MTEPLNYQKALTTLLRSAGEPGKTAVRAAMLRVRQQDVQVRGESTVADWIAVRRVPRDDKELELFLDVLQRMALERRRDQPPPRFLPRERWRQLAEQERTRRSERRRPADPPTAPSRSSALGRGWRKEVADSPVWRLLKTPADPLKKQAEQVADLLEELYEEARHELAGDPWHEEHLARRICGRTNQLVLLLWRDRENLLTPAEAAVITLLPFLHQAHRSRTAAELSHVEPTDLGHRSEPDGDRRMYERLLRGHQRLVRRAGLGDLNDRGDDGRPLIGWWLFHQWAKRQPGRLGDLLSAVRTRADDLDELGVVLDPDLLSRLLHCTQSSPPELFDSARPEHLRADAFQLDFHGRDFQDVRERLVGPLFVVAQSMAIEVTGLSSVIVRHVGIPEALTPGSLLSTLNKASWPPRQDGIALRAACDHPAVVAALTEHIQHLESLLRVVRRSGSPEFGDLPLFTWADEVREVDDSGAPVPVEGIIRFRLDEERVQELLMGENLYRDRSLAIRELYQNALDACRYRRTRSRAADPYSSYEGRIEFVQGFDEKEGRHYLECRDNGVGMDELTLSEVFSQAGIRFTDLPRYEEEQQEWQSSGVTLHPNSRFGIGVLSYFMLADEVRVTTCHMDRVNGRLRELTVLITGPGHYFRVRPTDGPGTTGTTVRLYLRDGGSAPSCVRQLRRFLGIAEFTTTARHGGEPVRWDPGAMRPREPMGVESNGFEAHGRHVSWSAGPRGEDGQVVWCENGGGILVDGIHAEPRVRRGILAGPGRLRGVVVNLTGATRPQDLSVDRTEILDEDLCLHVEQLIRGALPTLLSAPTPLLTHGWLGEVANESLRLADIVTEAAGAAKYELEVGGSVSAMSVTGFFPADEDIALPDVSAFEATSHFQSSIDAPTRLWRLLAHRPNPLLGMLTEIVPELNRVERVLPARPSDYVARTAGPDGWESRDWPSLDDDAHEMTAPGHGLFVASVSGLSYGEVLSRMAKLGLPAPEPPDGDPVTDEINLALVSHDLRGAAGGSNFLPTDSTVPPGHLLQAHFGFGISTEEAAQRLRAFRFRVPASIPSASASDELVMRLLSHDLDGQLPWLDPDEPVSPVHLYRAYASLGVRTGIAIRCLESFGFDVHGSSAMADEPDESTIRLFSRSLLGRGVSSPTPSVPVGPLFDTAIALQRPVADLAQELRAHGFHVESAAVAERLPLDVLEEGEEWGLSHRDWEMICATERIPPGLLVRIAAHRQTSPEEAARSFRALGFETPTKLPPWPEPTDPTILSVDLDELMPWFDEGDPVSLRHVVRASLETGTSPTAVVSRLRAYGLVPPDTSFPAGYGEGDAYRISFSFRDRGMHDDDDLPDLGRPVPLHYLLSVASQLSTEPRNLATWLATYGFQVLHDRLELLDETDHQLFRPSRRGGYDSQIAARFSLQSPLTDFLRIALASDLPAPELVERLERLDVDLDRVRDTVRAALPLVPGLVMKSEP